LNPAVTACFNLCSLFQPLQAFFSGNQCGIVSHREHWRSSATYIPNLGELIESIYLYSTSIESSGKVHMYPTTSAQQGLKLGEIS